MKTGLILVLLGLVLAVPGVATYGREILAVDSCLDSGGSFDYVQGVCDHQQTHHVVPFRRRHVLPTYGATLGGVLVVAGISMLLRRSRPNTAV